MLSLDEGKGNHYFFMCFHWKSLNFTQEQVLEDAFMRLLSKDEESMTLWIFSSNQSTNHCLNFWGVFFFKQTSQILVFPDQWSGLFSIRAFPLRRVRCAQPHIWLDVSFSLGLSLRLGLSLHIWLRTCLKTWHSCWITWICLGSVLVWISIAWRDSLAFLGLSMRFDSFRACLTYISQMPWTLATKQVHFLPPDRSHARNLRWVPTKSWRLWKLLQVAVIFSWTMSPQAIEFLYSYFVV